MRAGDRVIFVSHPDQPAGQIKAVDLQKGEALVEWLPAGTLIPPTQVVPLADLRLLFGPFLDEAPPLRCLCGGSSVYGDSADPQTAFHDPNYCPLGRRPS